MSVTETMFLVVLFVISITCGFYLGKPVTWLLNKATKKDEDDRYL